MFYFLLVVAIIAFCWPWISRWVQRMMARRAEDMLRRMMGMPSSKEERKRAKKRESKSTARGSAQHKKSAQTPDAADMMKSVAEDVEFVEVREFQQTAVETDTEGGKRVYREEQVSDVEFTEIKETKHPD